MSIEAYWAQREAVLSQYTYEWRLKQHVPSVADSKTFTTITFARKGDSTAVFGSMPTYELSNHTARIIDFHLFFGPGFVGTLSQPPNGDISKCHFSIFRTVPDSLASTGPEWAGLICGFPAPFLAGVDPFKLYRLSWSPTKLPDGRLAFQAKNYIGKDQVTIAMDFDSPDDFTIYCAPDGRLLRAEKFIRKYIPAYKLPYFTIAASKWREVAGYQIPSEVLFRSNLDVSGRNPNRYTELSWSLVKVYPTATAPQPPIPIGTQIRDWRAIQAEYQFFGMMFSDRQAIFYKWNGSLPKLTEIQRLDAATRPATPSLPGNALVFVAASVLLVVGLLLLIYNNRLRVSA